MAQSATIEVIGAVTARPAVSSLYSCTAQEIFPLNVCAVYPATKSGTIPVASTTQAPFILPLEGITRVRFLGVKLLSGSTMQVRLTWAGGVALIPVSDLQVWHSPAVGDEATEIAFIGTGDLVYLIAGDVS